MSELRVVRAGPRTTVQDGGRRRLAHLGIPTAGPVDAASLHAANAAVGNAVHAAALEITLGGEEYVAAGDVVLAICGAQVPIRVDGTTVESTFPMQLRDGQRLRIGTAKTGLYAYLAVAGGIAVDPVLGSRATDTLSGLGSPALTAGTTLPIGEAVARQPSESATPTIVDNTEPLAVAPGPHLPAMRPGVLTAFLDSSWTVTPAADRVALRLAGPVVEPGLAGIDSEGLVPGAIQLLPNGQPILFLANHPATGGYPVVAVVARGDLGRAAQSRPGATLSFVLRRH